MASGKQLAVLQGHEADCLSVACAPAAGWLVSASRDRTLRLWSSQDFQPLGEPLRQHTDCVNAVAVSPCGSMIASGSDDATIVLWDAQAVLDGGAAEGGPSKAAVRATLTGHGGSVWAVAFSPGSALLASGSLDTNVRLWDPRSGLSLATFEGHRATVWSVAFSPDGFTLASGSSDKSVRLWEVQAQQEAALARMRNGDARAAVTAAVAAPASRQAAPRSFAFLRAAQAPAHKPAAGGGDKPGGFAAVRDVRWIPYKHDLLTRDIGHSACIWGVAVSPDGTKIASCSSDMSICVWQAASGQQLQV